MHERRGHGIERRVIALADLERTEIKGHGLATVAPKGGVPATVIDTIDPTRTSGQ